MLDLLALDAVIESDFVGRTEAVNATVSWFD